MCVSCGCGQPNNDHGDQRNITQNDINNAAQAAGVTPGQVAQNIVNTQAATGTPSPVGAATSIPTTGQQIGGASQLPYKERSSTDDALNVKTTEAAMRSGTKPTDAGQTESTGQQTAGQSTGQQAGGTSQNPAGQMNPGSGTRNTKVAKEAMSSGTKPADTGQTESTGKTGQTGTSS